MSILSNSSESCSDARTSSILLPSTVTRLTAFPARSKVLSKASARCSTVDLAITTPPGLDQADCGPSRRRGACWKRETAKAAQVQIALKTDASCHVQHSPLPAWFPRPLRTLETPNKSHSGNKRRARTTAPGNPPNRRGTTNGIYRLKQFVTGIRYFGNQLAGCKPVNLLKSVDRMNGDRTTHDASRGKTKAPREVSNGMPC